MDKIEAHPSTKGRFWVKELWIKPYRFICEASPSRLSSTAPSIKENVGKNAFKIFVGLFAYYQIWFFTTEE